MRYSAWRIFREGLRGHAGWERVWRDPKPRGRYDVIIIGGGGHGLATAWYLASEHGVTDVAVLEKGWIGGGNVGRNTTIVRSNYLLAPNACFYEKSLKLWERLERELNFNVMMSQRGVINLFHSDHQRDAYARRGNAMRLTGIDAELLDRDALRARLPCLDFDNARFPIRGGLLQGRAGTARHDAVAWGFARAADRRGVDIIQQCEVKGIRVEGGRARGVDTSHGFIGANKIGIAVAGHTSQVARMAGITLPVESHLLQACVTEGLKPHLDCVVTFGAGHFYISQSNKGGMVFGGDLDGYNSYAARGNFPTIAHVARCAVSMIPSLSRVRLLRHWGGVMDMSFDGSPFICKTGVENLYLNGGWCYGGFKATPASGWCFAHTIARDAPHALNAPFTIERFREGCTLSENGAGPYPWLH